MGRTPFHIIGVVSNTKSFGLGHEGEPPIIYYPETAEPTGYARVFVRTTGDPAPVLSGWRLAPRRRRFSAWC